MDSPREALEKIINMCKGSRMYTRRTQAINDCAMRALGMTEGQRTTIHARCIKRSDEHKEYWK